MAAGEAVMVAGNTPKGKLLVQAAPEMTAEFHSASVLEGGVEAGRLILDQDCGTPRKPFVEMQDLKVTWGLLLVGCDWTVN